MDARERVLSGDLTGAYEQLRNDVRARPDDPSLRVFLFQLLAVSGDWERAITQLNVAADLDRSILLMAQVCRQLLNSEVFRGEVFAGKRAPLVFGEPRDWVGRLIQACQLVGQGEFEAAAELRDSAFEAAEAVPGTIDDTPFEWLADADTRLGPVIEIVIEGRYYWAPMSTIRLLQIEEPADLRDVIWLPATVMWRNQGQSVGFIPTRYPGSEAVPDDLVKLARRTEWRECPGNSFLGRGQRMFATDVDEYGIMNVRTIVFDYGDGVEVSAEDLQSDDEEP